MSSEPTNAAMERRKAPASFAGCGTTTGRQRHPALQARLDEFLAIELEDDELAWELDPDGNWHKVATVRGVNAQRALQELAVTRGEDER